MVSVCAISPEHGRGEGFSELIAGTWFGPMRWIPTQGGSLSLYLHSADLGHDVALACFDAMVRTRPPRVDVIALLDGRAYDRSHSWRAKQFLGPCRGDPLWMSPLVERLVGRL
jgi:hypothetical protein